MRKIGSQSFFDRHAYSDWGEKKENKFKKVLKKNLPDRTNHQKKEIHKELTPYDPKKKHRQVLIFWQALEFEKKQRYPRWYLCFYAILFGLVLYTFLTNNLFMSIIFIIFGFLFSFYEKKKPENYTFGVTDDGVFAQDRLYDFDMLDSFWIFYEPGGIKELSLKSQKPFLPYINIPLGSANPIKIREIILKHLPEKKHTKGFVDIIEKIL